MVHVDVSNKLKFYYNTIHNTIGILITKLCVYQLLVRNGWHNSQIGEGFCEVGFSVGVSSSLSKSVSYAYNFH